MSVEEGVLERARARAELGQRDAVLGRDRADEPPAPLRAPAGRRSRPTRARAPLAQQRGEPVAVGRAHPGHRPPAVRRAPARAGRSRAATPLGDHDDVVDALRDLGEQVARHEHRPPARGLRAQQVAHPADAGRVEAVGRLVEDQHLGVAEQRRGDRQALAHAHRVALHAPVGGGRSGRPGRAPRRRAPPGCRPAAASTRRWLRPRAAGMEARVLEHGADLGARVRQLLVAPAVERGRARRSGGRGRAASAASCSCRRRSGRGSRSPGPPRP